MNHESAEKKRPTYNLVLKNTDEWREHLAKVKATGGGIREAVTFDFKLGLEEITESQET